MAESSTIAVKDDDAVSVATLRKQYEDFASSKNAEIEEARSADHYYHSDQWTAAERAVLAARKQPVITYNRVGRKIDGLVGLVNRMRTDPKAYPRTPKQDQGAELGTAVMRYSLDQCDWAAKDPEACRDGAIGGIGCIELKIIEGDRGDRDIDLDIVERGTFFYDPRSIRPDFSDARFKGVAKWTDLDVAIELFPDKADEIRNLVSSGGEVTTQQDRDRTHRWVNSTLKQVFLVEHWYIKGGEWSWCFYCGLTELARGPSPYIDEKGKTFCRFIAFSAYVDHDGDRYGFVRSMKSPQDELNARRSKALHEMHTRRIIAEKGAVSDIEHVRKEAVRPDGYIEKNRGFEFEFDDASKRNDWEAQVALLQESKDEIENFGFNPALVGTGVQDMSGRAIALQQQAGMAELGPFILSYKGWKLRVYRAVWNTVQRIWTAERWIRVTDDDNVAQFIQLNGLGTDEHGQPQMVNALGSLDVDVILDEGPDTMNMMQDTRETLMALAQKGAQVPPAVLIEVSDLPSSMKKRLTDMIAQAGQPNPIQQQGAQLELEEKQAEIGKTKAEIYKIISDAMMAHKPEAPQAAQPPKGPSESINFKDLPPDAQAQMLAQAGIVIHPAVLDAHARDQAMQQAVMKAAARPQPQPAA